MQSRRTILRAGAGLALTATAVGAGTLPVFADAAGSGTGWAGLAARIQGDIVLPVDPGYAAAKELQIKAFDVVHPQAIAFPETPQDVQALVNYARGNAISVRVRSGGHNFNGWSTGEGLVIDTSRLDHATVGSSTVRIGPGLQSIDALTALAPYGKQVIAGTCPTVAPGGFISGGGIGFQTRKFGLGSDRLRSVQIVLADGRLVRASETSYSDLFWALRGSGGGNFGVVTEFEVTPIDAPRMVFFSAMWSWDQAEKVFAAWQTWQLNASVNLGSALIYNLLDAAPGNDPMVIVMGGYHGPEAEAQAALAQLTSMVGAQPTSTYAADLPYADAMKAAYGCGDLTQEQCHREGTGAGAQLHRTAFQRDAYRVFNKPFTPSQISTALGTLVADRVAGQRRVLHCMAVGGKTNTISPSATAFVHRQSNFVIGYVGQLDAPTPQSEAAASAFVETGANVLNPIANGAYVNFPGSNLPDWATQYYGDNYLRLKKVKKAYDPSNFFRHPRSIGSLGQ